MSGRIAASAYGFALVLADDGIILGRLRSSSLDAAPETPVEQRMSAGPSTVRPDIPAAELAQRLRDRELATAVLSTPEGRLLGIARRVDLERGSARA